MPHSHSHNLVLQLLGDELCDLEAKPFASIDQVIGAIVYELIQLASPRDGSPNGCNAEVILDRLVRIATHAARGAADLAIDSNEEAR